MNNPTGSSYGFVLSLAYGVDVRQVWFTLRQGAIYHRGGNTTSGWALTGGAWTAL